MNIHIELVKKSLANDDSVSLEELIANINDAYDAWAATDYKCDVEYVSFRAARAAYWAAYWAADEGGYWDDSAACDAAKRWKKLAIEAVAEYEELTK